MIKTYQSFAKIVVNLYLIQVEHGDRQYIEGYHVTLTSTMGSETYIVYSSLSTYRIVTNLLPYTQYRVDVSPFYESATATPSMFLTATMKEDGRHLK